MIRTVRMKDFAREKRINYALCLLVGAQFLINRDSKHDLSKTTRNLLKAMYVLSQRDRGLEPRKLTAPKSNYLDLLYEY